MAPVNICEDIISDFTHMHATQAFSIFMQQFSNQFEMSITLIFYFPDHKNSNGKYILKQVL
jgi:hypothetical protein